MNNTTNLLNIGYSKYNLTIDGKLYNNQNKEIKKDILNRFYITADTNKKDRISLKRLYRKAYNKEFSIDEINNLPNEQWKEIQGTQGKYFVSNCGRVKSLCGYNAKILKEYQNNKGYLTVKIKGKNYFIHRLVAFAFCKNNYNSKNVQIHHKDGNKANNHYKNLLIVSVTEHIKIHTKKGNKKQ